MNQLERIANLTWFLVSTLIPPTLSCKETEDTHRRASRFCQLFDFRLESVRLFQCQLEVLADICPIVTLQLVLFEESIVGEICKQRIKTPNRGKIGRASCRE